MIKYIILFTLWLLENLLAYKLIKKIDKNERIKVNKMETKHIEYMIEKMKEVKESDV